MGNIKKDAMSEKNYSFEMPPDPIPAGSIRETLTADVVVVGGGIAGTCAAVSAAEAGARTILIEKQSTCQGRGLMYGVIGSRLQKKLGIEIDKDEVVLNLMKLAGNRPDQRLLRMWANGSGASMDWLMDMTDAAGIQVFILNYPPPASFNNAEEYYPQYLTTHHFVVKQRSDERRVINSVMEQARRKGVAMYFNTQARQLLREGKSRVTGVIACNSAGDFVQYNAARAVVLCTGDYGNNSEMVAKYCPQASGLKPVVMTSTGDGHQMAMWAGAAMEPGPHTPLTHGNAGPLGAAGFLSVNIKGERFHNEDVPGYCYFNAVMRQPGQTAWQVFDSKYPEELPHMGIGLGKMTQATDDILEYAEMQHAVEKKLVEKQSIKADTLEDLAKKMKVPAAAFLATLARYNDLAHMGKDLDFGKRADRLTTIEKPPFYAGRDHNPAMYLVILGGLNVNPELQALDKDWQVIPGLYLAGNTMGNRFAVDYPTMVPGLSHGMCVHFGRVAGYNAATLES
jgi:fumarate reductase flavoprotein subunit